MSDFPLSKIPRNTWKYPIVSFNTPTRSEPNPLPCIFSNTRPNIEKPCPLGTDDNLKNLLYSVLAADWMFLPVSHLHQH